MKIWVKYLAGLILGFSAGVIFHSNSAAAIKIVKPVAEIFVNIGRYGFYPLIFFSLAIGIHELILNGKFLRIHRNTIISLFAASLFTTITGILISLLFSPDRIPILLEKKAVQEIPSVTEQFLLIFPKNLFAVLPGNSSFILPLVFLAFLLGINFGFDKIITKPVVQLFDSFNRLFYNINSLILEIMAPGMGFFASYLFFSVSSLTQIALYRQLILIIFISTIFVVFLVFPAVLYIIGFKEKPYKYLYAITGAAIAGFLTGDNYLANNVLIRHCHENLGISRKTGAATISLFTIFGRAGTALVSAVCFIVMIHSYSSIELSFFQISYITFFIFIASFALCAVPGSGVLVLLTLACSNYGHGIEDGYLLFTPVLPLLLGFAVLVDVISAGISAMIISHFENERNEIEAREFI